ncbi:hypothetical protein CLOP_g1726 [Closterium sp. NIES-67]|nr:hypothetical protein CLOP_g1726 [Closterium sp. NIES-67]
MTVPAMPRRFFASPALPPASPSAGCPSASPGYCPADEASSARNAPGHLFAQRTASGHVSSATSNGPAESSSLSETRGKRAEGGGGAVYEPYCSDFGPLSMACVHRYCDQMDHAMQEARGEGRRVVHICSSAPHKKANAAVLLAAYLILRHALPADAAHAVLRPLEPLAAFRDASSGACTFHLAVLDCCKALERAQRVGLTAGFSVLEYERLEQADLTWMVPGRLLAFSTPADDAASAVEGYLAPEDYVQYFRQAGIAAIIRLNRRVYDKRRFTRHGFAFYDLYFTDGGAPSDGILERFFAVVEGSNGPVAIHCKAGLGRTGVLVGCYLMKHCGMTAREAIAYTRLVRPGSVIGQQQHFLAHTHPRMARAGDDFRRKAQAQSHAPRTPATAVPDMPSQAAAFSPSASPEPRMPSHVLPHAHGVGAHALGVQRSASHTPPARVGRKVYARSDEQAAAAVAELQFARHSRSLARTASASAVPAAGSASLRMGGSMRMPFESLSFTMSPSLPAPISKSVSMSPYTPYTPAPGHASMSPFASAPSPALPPGMASPEPRHVRAARRLRLRGIAVEVEAAVREAQGACEGTNSSEVGAVRESAGASRGADDSGHAAVHAAVHAGGAEGASGAAEGSASNEATASEHEGPAAAAAGGVVGAQRKGQRRLVRWLGLSSCGLLPVRPAAPSQQLASPPSPAPSTPTAAAAAASTGGPAVPANPDDPTLPTTISSSPSLGAGAADEAAAESAPVGRAAVEEVARGADVRQTRGSTAAEPAAGGRAGHDGTVINEYQPPDADLAPRFGRAQVNGSQGEGLESAAGGSGVFVRVINAVGQPRKVVAHAARGRRQVAGAGTGVRGGGEHVLPVSMGKFGAVQGGRFRLGVRR